MAVEKTIVKCETTSTFSSVIGNITAFATEFFKGKFPPGYFKKVIISEELNNIIMSEEKDVIKYPHPYMVIRPELDLDNTFTQTLPKWYNDTHYVPKHSLRDKGMYSVLRDEEREIYIYCVPTRIKINFNVRIKLATVMAMYNLVQTIRNTFIRETYEYLNEVRLQTELPKKLILTLAKFLDYNLSDSGDRESFIKYLNKNSLQGIEENINMSTGNSMYAFNYIVNILSSYPESPQFNKNIKNLVVEDTSVDFMFSFDLWIPNRFFMELPNNSIDEQIIYEEDDKFKYNLVLDVHYILPKIENKNLLIKKSFIPDVNVEYDELKFSSILNKELKEVLQLLKNENALSEDIFKVIVMCGNKLLPRELYKIDYENFVVKTYFPMINTTYTLLVYGDLETLNEISNTKTVRLVTDSRNNNVSYDSF